MVAGVAGAVGSRCPQALRSPMATHRETRCWAFMNTPAKVRKKIDDRRPEPRRQSAHGRLLTCECLTPKRPALHPSVIRGGLKMPG